MVLQATVAAGSVRFGGAGQKITSFHIGVLEQAFIHFLTDVGVESFDHINLLSGIYIDFCYVKLIKITESELYFTKKVF